MHDVISAATTSPRLVTLKGTIPLCAQSRMGCSTSSQTSAVDTTRPSAKPEESNGASTTGAANENGKVAEDSETIPDQTPAEDGDAKPADEPPEDAKPADEPPEDATSADNTAAAPPAGEAPPAAADGPPAEAAAPAEAEAGAADSTAETTEAAAAAPEGEKVETPATDSEPKTEEAPVPSE